MGGIYVDTDVFACQSFDELRQHDFTMGFDNVVPLARDYIANPDPKASDTLHRLNNGIMLAKPNATFLKIWAKEYHNFDPGSFLHHSSVIPFRLATQYPDLIHVEMHRISPISFGLQTADTAVILTCGFLLPSTYSRKRKGYNMV